MNKVILTINLGTTSTRLSIHDETKMLSEKNLYHSNEEIKDYTQKEHVEKRLRILHEWLKELKIKIDEIDAIALRVAYLPKSILGGTIQVNGKLRKELSKKYSPNKPLSHGNDITIALADAFCGEYSIPYYIIDPANQNNMIEEAKISGHPLFERTTIFHALNQKRVAYIQAKRLGKTYRESNFIIAHMGGGISVSAHKGGRIIDTNNCGGEEGAFSGTRTGTLPALQLAQLCFSGKYTLEDVLGMLLWNGGVSAYLGTNDMREVEARAKSGDKEADLIFRTVAYRTAKEIAALSAAICGDIDGIILTGGMSNSKRMCNMISRRVSRLAPVSVYAGEYESEALAAGVLRVLNGEEELAIYPD